MSKNYFATDALSNSGIKEILKSPAHFRHWTDNPKKSTSAFRIGHGFHAYMQNMERDDVLTFTETKTFDSKAGAAFLEAYPDHICLTLEEKMKVSEMVNAMHRNPKLISILDSCRKEVEIYGREETEFGPIQTKAMLDAVSATAIYDYKTTDESAREFPWTAKKYRYDIQAAWYQDRAFIADGIQRDFYFIVVEKNPPFGILVYQAGELFIQSGRDSARRASNIYAGCKALNLWPAYDTNEILVLN
jgi:hypothetical protein